MECLGHEQGNQQRPASAAGGGETETGAGQGGDAQEHEQGGEESFAQKVGENGEKENEES